MSTQNPPPPPLTIRQTLASNDFGLPMLLILLLLAFNGLVSSYELAFPMKVWLWTTNVGAVMVIVGMWGARRGKVKEI
ncbi:hypothetical protein E4T49_00808 [Aureobasidium sp. EXF-10728]|nr:hypothetical protein E4T49_00808 [Aureobasidium sp. EXF-10728]